jgi:hypothetical protein
MKGKQHLDHAILLSTDEEITLESYLTQYSKRTPPEIPSLVCPVCRDEVHLSRMHDRNRTPTFVHRAGEKANCPLVNIHHASTAFAVAHAYELRLEQERREQFMERWALYLAEIRRHVPTYSIERFATTVAHADVLHIWSCPTLTETDVLYLFLALSAFVSETPGVNHPTWLRYLFDASVSSVTDLHPTGRPAPRLFQLRYRSAHHAMFPNANQLLDWREVATSDAFLRRRGATVPESERKTFAGLMTVRPVTLEDEGPTIPIPDTKGIMRNLI